MKPTVTTACARPLRTQPLSRRGASLQSCFHVVVSQQTKQPRVPRSSAIWRFVTQTVVTKPRFAFAASLSLWSGSRRFKLLSNCPQRMQLSTPVSLFLSTVSYSYSHFRTVLQRFSFHTATWSKHSRHLEISFHRHRSSTNFFADGISRPWLSSFIGRASRPARAHSASHPHLPASYVQPRRHHVNTHHAASRLDCCTTFFSLSLDIHITSPETEDGGNKSTRAPSLYTARAKRCAPYFN